MTKHIWVAVLAATALYFSACSEDDTVSSSEFHGADYLFNSQSEMKGLPCDKNHENSTAYYKPDDVILSCEYSSKYKEWVWTASSNNEESSSSKEDDSSSSNGSSSSAQSSSSSKMVESSSSVKSDSSERLPKDTTSAERPERYELPELDSASIKIAEPCVIDSVDNCEYGTFTDARDGHIYKTINIGTQTWMAENLTFQYHSSSAIGGRPNTQIHTGFNGCLHTTFNNDDCPADSVVYTWSAAMDSAGLFSEDAIGCGDSTLCYNAPEVQGVCPEGWHLPNINEWKELAFATNLSSTDSLNARGFNLTSTSSFNDFWSSTEEWINHVYLAIFYADMGFYSSTTRPKDDNRPVRCVKNTSNQARVKTSYFIDKRNGEFYKTAKIGNQTWMAQDLQYPYRDAVRSYDDYPAIACNAEEYHGKGYQLNYKYSWAAVVDSLGNFDGIGKGCGSFVDCDIKETIVGVCPEGWHIPDSTEWAELINYVKKDNPTVGTANSLASIYFSNRATNKYGFTVTATGYASYEIGSSLHVTKDAYFWTATQHSEYSAVAVVFKQNFDDARFDSMNKKYMYSIRCVED